MPVFRMCSGTSSLVVGCGPSRVPATVYSAPIGFWATGPRSRSQRYGCTGNRRRYAMAPVPRIATEDLRRVNRTIAAATSAPFEKVRMIADHSAKAEIALTTVRSELHHTIGSDMAKYAAAVLGYSNDPLNRWIWPI